MNEDEKLDGIKEGDIPTPGRLRKLPRPTPPSFSGFNVDTCTSNIHAYLNNRLYHLCLEEARTLFNWYLAGGYFPVPYRRFDISEWPEKRTELYRLLLYCNMKREREDVEAGD